MHSCLYQCQVRHERRVPKRHAFTHNYFLFCLDLDELDAVARSSWLIGHNSRAWYRFCDDDHFPYRGADLKERVVNYLADHGVKEAPGRITLLTSLRTAGYIFNPAAFFYIFDTAGKPLAAILQITNTFYEQKLFLLTAADFQDGAFRALRKKKYYISPFMSPDFDMDICLHLPGDQLSASVDVVMGEQGRNFFASVTGKQRTLNGATLAWFSLIYPFVTLKVISLIHLHAIVLAIKRVPFFWKDENEHLQRGFFRERHTGGFKP